MYQVQAGIKFQLMVVGLHMPAQLIKTLVVVFFLQVRQFMHDDHIQQIFRCLLEHGADPDLILTLEFAALDPGQIGMQSQCVVDHVNFVVEHHLAQGV